MHHASDTILSVDTESFVCGLVGAICPIKLTLQHIGDSASGFWWGNSLLENRLDRYTGRCGFQTASPSASKINGKIKHKRSIEEGERGALGEQEQVSGILQVEDECQSVQEDIGLQNKSIKRNV